MDTGTTLGKFVVTPKHIKIFRAHQLTTNKHWKDEGDYTKAMTKKEYIERYIPKASEIETLLQYYGTLPSFVHEFLLEWEMCLIFGKDTTECIGTTKTQAVSTLQEDGSVLIVNKKYKP